VITVSSGADTGIQAGQYISTEVADTRRWRRLVYWLFRLGTPMVTRRYKVTAVSGGTLFTLPENEG